MGVERGARSRWRRRLRGSRSAMTAAVMVNHAIAQCSCMCSIEVEIREVGGYL